MPMSPKCKFRISPTKRISLSYPWPNYDLYLFVNVLQKLCKVSLPKYVLCSLHLEGNDFTEKKLHTTSPNYFITT